MCYYDSGHIQDRVDYNSYYGYMIVWMGASGFDSQLGAPGSREFERQAGSFLGAGNWEQRWREELGSSWEPGSPPKK